MNFADVNQLELKNERAIGKSQGLAEAMEVCLEAVKHPHIDARTAIAIQAVANLIYARATVATAEARALHTELGRAIGAIA